ncbi:MAG TPA: hypothetical protein VIJ47_09010 [Acidimicrobiales bacterium]
MDDTERGDRAEWPPPAPGSRLDWPAPEPGTRLDWPPPAPESQLQDAPLPPPPAGPGGAKRSSGTGTTIWWLGLLVLAVVALSMVASRCNSPAPRSPTVRTVPRSNYSIPSVTPTTRPTCPGGGVGVVEAATAVPGGIRATGWAGCGVTGPMQLYVDLDGRRVAGPLPADMRRTDSHSGYGYDITIPAKPGPRSVCVFAYSDKLLPCITVTVP